MSFNVTPKSVVIGIWLAIGAFLFACFLGGADLNSFLPPVICFWLATGCTRHPMTLRNWHTAFMGPLVWLA
jgi:hypothetical protein